MTDCTLCGLPTPDPPVTGDDVDGPFCCRGCLEVYRAVGDVDPVTAADALAPDEAATTVPADAETVHLHVQGMHCTTCEAFLEGTARRDEAVYDAAASYTTDVLELSFDPTATTAEALADEVSGLGYRAAPADQGGPGGSRDAREFARMRVFLAAFLGMTTMGMYAGFVYPAYLGVHWSGLLATPAAAISLFGPIIGATTLELLVVGFPILRGAYVALRMGYLNMDVLIALGALVPYLYSLAAFFYLGRTVVYFDVTTTVITVVTLGTYLEGVVKRRALDGVEDARATRVTEATRVTDAGDPERVPTAACEPGDRLRVGPDERVPVDGRVVAGTAVVDESLLTGESHPNRRREGDPVVGGSTVVDGTIDLAVGERVESTLDRIVDSMRHVQSAGSGAQRLADRIAGGFVPLVVFLAALTAVAWVLLGATPRSAFLTGVSVLVVSCPCSLGLATPIALVAGVRAAAARDVAILNTATLEELAAADVVAFDKTGTLTTGEMTVESVVAPEGEPAVLRRAAAVESTATHPVAAAIAGAVDEPPAARSSRPEGRHQGVSAVVEGERVTVGHPDCFDDARWPEACREAVAAARSAGALPAAVGWGGRVRGVVTVDDTPRPGWEETLADLHAAGHRIVVITGDDRSRVAPFEDSPVVDDVFAEVTPEAKVEVVRRLAAEGTTVMLGDGTNDAPALAAADLGVALAGGTDVTLEAADATVLSDGLDAVVDAFEVGAETRSRVRQNLAWAFGYNALALPLAALGLVNPLVASLAMAASSVIVVLNAARSFHGRTNRPRAGRERRGSRSGGSNPPATAD